MPDQIHIYHNNQQEGPYSPEQLRDMIAKGAVTPVTLAWKIGMSGWAPLNTISTLAETQQSAEPPSSPTVRASPEPSLAPSPAAAAGPAGVGGWLLLFCVGLTIFSPLFGLLQMSSNWSMTEFVYTQYPSFKTAVEWENIASTALLIYGFIAGCRIWSGSLDGREIAQRFLLVRLLGFFGIELIAVVIMRDMPSKIVSSAIGAVIGGGVWTLIWFLIWWFYFKKSKRVRNTYGAN